MLNLPKQGEEIDFRKIDPHESFRAVLKTLFELEGCYEELTAAEIEDLELKFDTIYNEIDQNITHLNYAYSTFDLMAHFKQDRFTLRKLGNSKLGKVYGDIRKAPYKSKKIFRIMLELEKQGDKLTKQQHKIVRRYLTEGKLNGLHLKTDLAVDQIKRTIDNFVDDFIDHVNIDSRKFVQKVINAEYVKTVPANLRSMVEGQSKVNLTYNPLIYEHFLANCDDQHARYEYWYAYNNRASLNTCPPNLSNNILVDDIVLKRRQLAEHLGFVNYIEYSLQTRTLDSVIAIKEFIEKLHEQSREVFNQDLQQILASTADFKNYKSKEFNIWDLPFFANQLRNRQLKKLNEQVVNYLPVTKVIEGAFKFMDTNLNVKVEKIDCTHIDETHPLGDTLEYYRMYHNDKFAGNFYMNLYSKIRQPQVRFFTDRCDALNVTPIAGLFLNYSKPFEGQHFTMSFPEAVGLFRSVSFDDQFYSFFRF